MAVMETCKIISSCWTLHWAKKLFLHFLSHALCRSCNAVMYYHLLYVDTWKYLVSVTLISVLRPKPNTVCTENVPAWKVQYRNYSFSLFFVCVFFSDGKDFLANDNQWIINLMLENCIKLQGSFPHCSPREGVQVYYIFAAWERPLPMPATPCNFTSTWTAAIFKNHSCSLFSPRKAVQRLPPNPCWDCLTATLA